VSIGFTLKSKFSSRVRAILRKLHKRVGSINDGGSYPSGLNSMDGEKSSENSRLRQYLPDKDVPLLEYVIKQQKRSDRKSKKSSGTSGSNNQLDDLLGSDSEDDDDNNNASTGALDYRANKAERPKATRLVDATGATIGSNPRSLSGMINEIQYSKRKGKTAATGEKGDDEDDDYKVSVSDAGHVVISEKRNGADGKNQ
jgi:hypothetical protein